MLTHAHLHMNINTAFQKIMYVLCIMYNTFPILLHVRLLISPYSPNWLLVCLIITHIYTGMCMSLHGQVGGQFAREVLDEVGFNPKKH